MHILETVAGIVIVALAIALAAGVVDQIIPLPDVGIGATLAIVLVGGLLAAHGLVRRRLQTDGPQSSALRWRGRTGWTLVQALALVIAVPAFVAPLNLITIAGFPLGYYAAAQGALIALALVALRAAHRLDSLEADIEVSDRAAMTGPGQSAGEGR